MTCLLSVRTQWFLEVCFEPLMICEAFRLAISYPTRLYRVSHKNVWMCSEAVDSMGWESGPVKRQLKLLQWQFGKNTISALPQCVCVCASCYLHRLA